jgi:hypothetical protein
VLDLNFPPFETQLRDMRQAAHGLGIDLRELRASTDAEIDLAFDTIAQRRLHAIAVAAGPF